jgi:hypothetical protein
MDIEVADIQVVEDPSSERGGNIVEAAGDRTGEIALERSTATAGRRRADVKRVVIPRDHAMAAGIIAQTDRSPENTPARYAAIT